MERSICAAHALDLLSSFHSPQTASRNMRDSPIQKKKLQAFYSAMIIE